MSRDAELANGVLVLQRDANPSPTAMGDGLAKAAWFCRALQMSPTME